MADEDKKQDKSEEEETTKTLAESWDVDPADDEYVSPLDRKND